MTTEQQVATYAPAGRTLSVPGMLRGIRRQWLWF